MKLSLYDTIQNVVMIKWVNLLLNYYIIKTDFIIHETLCEDNL